MSNVYRARHAQKAACLASLTKVFAAFLDIRVILKFHPAYRPRTRADDAFLDQHTRAIAQMVREKNNTEGWNLHALVGQNDRYHVIPDAEDFTYLVQLHDGRCIIEEVLAPFTSCSFQRNTDYSTPS